MGRLARTLRPETAPWGELKLNPADMVAYGAAEFNTPPPETTTRARKAVQRLGLGGMILRVRWSYPGTRPPATMPLMWYFMSSEAAAPVAVPEALPVPGMTGQRDATVRALGALLRLDSAHVTVASAHSVVRWLHVLSGTRAVREGLLNPQPWIGTASERLPRILTRIGEALREGAMTSEETSELQRQMRMELDTLASAVRAAVQEAGRIEAVLARADRRIRAVEDEATAEAREIEAGRQRLAMEEELQRARSNRHGLNDVRRSIEESPRTARGVLTPSPWPRHGAT